MPSVAPAGEPQSVAHGPRAIAGRAEVLSQAKAVGAAVRRPCETLEVRKVGSVIFALAAFLFAAQLLVLFVTKLSSGDLLGYTDLVMCGLGSWACASMARQLARSRQPAN